MDVCFVCLCVSVCTHVCVCETAKRGDEEETESGRAIFPNLWNANFSGRNNSIPTIWYHRCTMALNIWGMTTC